MFHLLFQALLPVICGAVTTPLFNVIQKGIGVVTKLPPPITRIVVGATAAGVYALGVKGFALTGSDVLTVTPSDVGVMTSAGLSYLFHLAEKVKPPA